VDFGPDQPPHSSLLWTKQVAPVLRLTVPVTGSVSDRPLGDVVRIVDTMRALDRDEWEPVCVFNLPKLHRKEVVRNMIACHVHLISLVLKDPFISGIG
jgi:hypothetical protein